MQMDNFNTEVGSFFFGGGGGVCCYVITLDIISDRPRQNPPGKQMVETTRQADGTNTTCLSGPRWSDRANDEPLIPRPTSAGSVCIDAPNKKGSTDNAHKDKDGIRK